MDTLPDRPAPPRPASEVVISWLRWFGVGRLVVTMTAVVAVGAGGYWLLRSPATPVENTLPHATTTSVRPPSTSVTEPEVSTPIVVYVTGAVTVPGVYELPVAARVQQAVVAAGGMTADADADKVNLAGFLGDGDRIYIPRVGVPVPAVITPAGGSGGAAGSNGPGGAALPSPTSSRSGPLDLNQATLEQLDQLPGIGPSTAAAIVAHRDAHGPFATVDELLDVRGIGPAKLEAIRSLISV